MVEGRAGSERSPSGPASCCIFGSTRSPFHGSFPTMRVYAKALTLFFSREAECCPLTCVYRAMGSASGHESINRHQRAAYPFISLSRPAQTQEASSISLASPISFIRSFFVSVSSQLATRSSETREHRWQANPPSFSRGWPPATATARTRPTSTGGRRTT